MREATPEQPPAVGKRLEAKRDMDGQQADGQWEDMEEDLHTRGSVSKSFLGGSSVVGEII